MSQSNSTPSGSPRISHQHDDLESQYRSFHTEQLFLGSEKSLSPRLTILDRQTPSCLSSSPASPSPTQLSTLPSPMPQVQRISNDTASAGIVMGEYRLRSSPDAKRNRSPRQRSLQPVSIPKQSKDIYVDMHLETPSPCTPLPVDNMFGPFSSSPLSSPPSSPRQAHVRPRTASSASLKKHANSTPRCANTGAISPRVSREAARRMVQDFPPPPPPRIPPPAIPVDAQELSYGQRTPRRETSTVTAAGKEAQTGSCLQSESSRGKDRRSRTSSAASVKNMVIRPPTSPPPVHRAPSQHIPQLYSGELSIGHLRNQSQASSAKYHNRPQIPNKSVASLKSSTSSRPPSWYCDNTQPEEPTSPTSQARRQSPSLSPKSDLTQSMSTNVNGNVTDGSQDLGDIIAGAIAITATKKQIEINS